MDIFEVEQKERLTREEVAARLRTLADGLGTTTTSSSSAAGCDSPSTSPTSST